MKCEYCNDTGLYAELYDNDPYCQCEAGLKRARLDYRIEAAFVALCIAGVIMSVIVVFNV
jgi:hypothetical protein